MPRISLPQNTFTPIPEGRHVFYIYGIEYDDTFGKLAIYLVNAKNRVHVQKYSFFDDQGQPRDSVYAGFSYFARTALNNPDLADVDPNELVGHFIAADVVHAVVPSTTNPAETRTFVNLKGKYPADGFDEEPVPAVLERVPALTKKSGTALDDFLNAVD